MENTTPTATATPAATAPSFRLRRSRTDRMLGGVLGGLAADLDVDVTLLRIGLVALTILSGGISIPIYAVAWLLTPEADEPTLVVPVRP